MTLLHIWTKLRNEDRNLRLTRKNIVNLIKWVKLLITIKQK